MSLFMKKEIYFFVLSFEEICAHLASLYDIVKRGDAEHLEEATNQIQELNNTPDSIFYQISLFNETKDEYIAKLSILTLNRLIPIHVNSLSPEQIESLKSFFSEALNSAHELSIYNHLCNGAATFTKIEGIEWPEIFQIAQSLVGTEETVTFGLHLWNSIFTRYSGEDSRQHLFELLSVCSNILEASEEASHRLESLSFIQKHMIRIEECQTEEEKALSDQLLQQLFTIMTTTESAEEETQVANIFSYFFAEDLPFFEETKAPVIEAALQICADEERDIDTRILIHNIIEASAFIIASEMQENITEIVTNTIQLSIEACQRDREATDYMFPLSFFYALSTAYDAEKEEIFEIFFQISHELIESEELESKQVGLLTLRSIIEGLQEVVSARIDDFIGLVLEGSAGTGGEDEDDDEILVISVCETIRELTDTIPDSLNVYVEQLTAYLIERSYINDAIIVLDNMYYRVQHPPLDLEGIVTVLTTGIEEASSYRIEIILSCLTSSFSHATDVDESVYEGLSPFLTSVLEAHPDLRGPILECYGRMAHISPQSILGQLGEIIDSVEESFSIEDFPVEYSCICIEQIAEVLSLSMAESIETIVPPLFGIIQGDYTTTQVASAIKALAKLLGLMPEAMSDYSPRIIDYLMKKPFEDISFMIPCLEGTAFAVDGFRELELDPSMFITTFLPVIKGADSKDIVSGVLMLIGTVFSACVTITPEIFEFSSEIFIPAVSGEFINLKRSDASNEIDPQIIRPLFYALNQFLKAAKQEQASKLIEPLFEAMRGNLELPSVVLNCYTLNVFSNICSVCNLTDELFNITLSGLLQIIGSEDHEVKRINSQSFLNLMHVGSEMMKSVSQQIYEYSLAITGAIVQGEFDSLPLARAAVALFCTTFTTYQIEVDGEFLQELIGFLPPPVDSDEIVPAAKFAIYMIENSIFPEKANEIILQFLASSDWYVQQCDETIVSQLISIVGELDESDIAAALHFNEKYISNVQKRLQSV